MQFNAYSAYASDMGREKVEKLFILEELASLVLDVAPLQRSIKIERRVETVGSGCS